jgi:demethylmenaquinone methyltransferase/2-methoxy-6-polyprenyl-1,4-benzoquinol methylase
LKLKLDHFTFLAPFYERFIPPRVPEKIIALANLTGKETVLDAGGGTGRVSQFLIGKAEQIVVADQSFGMLQEARSKEKLQLICSETEDLPVANYAFDRIIMVDALHHVGSQEKTIRELWRVLKSGGLIIIEEPNIHSIGVRLIAFAEKLFLMRSHFLSPGQIACLFSFPNGQVRVEVEGSTSWIIVGKGVI